MANPVKGEVPLKLADGRKYKLVLDMEALVQAEGVYGKNMEEMFADATRGFVGASRALLWGALQCHHPSVSLREASAMFASDGELVGKVLEDAAEVAFPDTKAKSGNAKSARGGKTSGRSGAKRG